MISGLAVAVCLTLGPAQCATCGPSGGGGVGFAPGAVGFAPGTSTGSWVAGEGLGNSPYDAVSAGGGGGGDQLYPFDSPEPWLHGFFQEMPAYGGYHTFTPRNYKHVLAHMEVASRWGIDPTMPYSHQFYNAYRQRAGMHPDFGSPQAQLNRGSETFSAAPVMVGSTASGNDFQQVAAIERSYPGAPYRHANVQQDVSGNQSNDQAYRLELLQKQVEMQNLQLQLLQAQLRNSQYTAQPWQEQNAAPSQEYPAQGYQELPPPPSYVTPPQFSAQPQLQHQAIPQGHTPADASHFSSPPTAPGRPTAPSSAPVIFPAPGQAYYVPERDDWQPGLTRPNSQGFSENSHAAWTYASPQPTMASPALLSVPSYGPATSSSNYRGGPQVMPQQMSYPGTTQTGQAASPRYQIQPAMPSYPGISRQPMQRQSVR